MALSQIKILLLLYGKRANKDVTHHRQGCHRAVLSFAGTGHDGAIRIVDFLERNRGLSAILDEIDFDRAILTVFRCEDMDFVRRDDLHTVDKSPDMSGHCQKGKRPGGMKRHLSWRWHRPAHIVGPLQSHPRRIPYPPHPHGLPSAPRKASEKRRQPLQPF